MAKPKTDFTAEDRRFMRRALRLARRGLGWTRPNPAVGAVIVKEGRIIGEGFHRRAGEDHAEIVALKSCRESPRGAAIYVTLEPCGHFGRTPPCSHALAKAGIRRVYFGSPDPNPVTAGKGLRYLRQKGVEVIHGPLSEEADWLNGPYFTWVKEGRPLVTAKWAMTLDGKIATRTGQSRWISGPEARRLVHQLRAEVDAILVGTNTVLRDNPLLTCRIRGGRNPVRIVLDRRLRLSEELRIFGPEAATILVTSCSKLRGAKAKRLARKGIQLLGVAEKKGRLNLRRLLELLGKQGFHHLLVEGGGETVAGFLQDGLLDRILVFIAPRIFGGKQAPGPVGGRGVGAPDAAWRFRLREIRRVGKDLALWFSKES